MFGSEVVLEGLGCLIIQALELGAESHSAEAGVEKLVGLEDDFSFAILEGCYKNSVAVIVINDKYVTVALAGGGGEPTGEVHVHLASGGHDGSVAIMCALSREGQHHIIDRVRHCIIWVSLIVGWGHVERMFWHCWSR